MKYIALTSSVKNQYSMVSNVFIDTFMRDANGEFIKVYLYLLRCEDGNMPVTVSDIADKLNMTENDILRALKYWNRLNMTAAHLFLFVFVTLISRSLPRWRR